MNLVPFQPKHITAEYLNWLNDKGKIRYSRHSGSFHTKETSLEYLKSFQETPNHFWALCDDGRMVGTATAYIESNSADVGLLIGYPGNHYGSHAWAMIMDFLRDQGIKKLTGGCHQDNIAMVRIMQRAGMRLMRVDGPMQYYVMEL